MFRHYATLKYAHFTFMYFCILFAYFSWLKFKYSTYNVCIVFF